MFQSNLFVEQLGTTVSAKSFTDLRKKNHQSQQIIKNHRHNVLQES